MACVSGVSNTFRTDTQMTAIDNCLSSPQVGAHAEQVREEFDHGLVRFLPNLRAFACALSRDVNRADDLVQETIAKALANRDKFAHGSNQLAWLFTILRNTFLSEVRRNKSFGVILPQLQVHKSHADTGNQHDHIALEEMVGSLRDLPPHQRRAVTMIGAWGFSYEEVALAENCAVGTVKSRVNRARTTLAAKAEK